MWHEILPYAVPLVVAGLILRRGFNAKPRKVRLGTLWLMPGLIALGTASILASSPAPSLLWLAGFAAALGAGLALGWLRARHMELAINETTGIITSKATPIGTMLVAALFTVRFALKLIFPELNTQPDGHAAGAALMWTDAGLLFSSGLVWGRAVTTWLRARPLLHAHHAVKSAGAE